MGGSPEGAGVLAFVYVVVDEAEDGLEEEEGNDDDADYGVVFVDLVRFHDELMKGSPGNVLELHVGGEGGETYELVFRWRHGDVDAQS